MARRDIAYCDRSHLLRDSRHNDLCECIKDTQSHRCLNDFSGSCSVVPSIASDASVLATPTCRALEMKLIEDNPTVDSTASKIPELVTPACRASGWKWTEDDPGTTAIQKCCDAFESCVKACCSRSSGRASAPCDTTADAFESCIKASCSRSTGRTGAPCDATADVTVFHEIADSSESQPSPRTLQGALASSFEALQIVIEDDDDRRNSTADDGHLPTAGDNSVQCKLAHGHGNSSWLHWQGLRSTDYADAETWREEPASDNHRHSNSNGNDLADLEWEIVEDDSDSHRHSNDNDNDLADLECEIVEGDDDNHHNPLRHWYDDHRGHHDHPDDEQPSAMVSCSQRCVSLQQPASVADAGTLACPLVRDGPGSAHTTAMTAHTGASHSAGGLYPGPFCCVGIKTGVATEPPLRR